MTEAFVAKRAIWKYTQAIEAPPATVFPLLCPVREAEWLDGWRYELVYSESGLVEPGCVFTTPGDHGEADTVWVVTRHDRAALRVEFARFTPENRVCTLAIRIEADGTQRSRVHITYVYTGLTETGDRFVEAFGEDAFLRAVQFWEKAMNHFLATGAKLLRNT